MITFSQMATDRLAKAKDAFASGGVLGAVGQIEHVVEAVNGMYLNVEALAPEHQLPELSKRVLDAMIAADDLRLDSMNGKRPEEFLARCDAQVATLAALAADLRQVRFP
jgi:hypothetical protein